MNTAPRVSIVVPAFNEEAALGECIDALRRQAYRAVEEIIVVDNASTDATAAIARAAGCRVVSEPRRGYVHAVAAGFSAARGEIIASTDADTVVPPQWLQRLVQGLLVPGTVACGTGFVFSDGPAWVRMVGLLFGRMTWHVAGASMAVWRRSFDAVGGFDARINLGADVDLHQRLQRVGRVVVNHSFLVPTSSRRFTYSFARTVWRNYFNDLYFILFRRPFYHDFPAVRARPGASRVERRRGLRRSLLTAGGGRDGRAPSSRR